MVGEALEDNFVACVADIEKILAFRPLWLIIFIWKLLIVNFTFGYIVLR